jgi:ABC-type Fe3+-hydroxamate transport system substrate-binding protein
MGDTDDRPADAEAVSRRRWLAGTAALVGSGLVAGCTGNEGTPTGVGDAEKGGSTADTPTAAPATDTATSSATPTATARETGTGTSTATPATPYSAELAPAGEVTFEAEPESVFTVMGHHAEMALLLGRGEDVNAVYAPGYVDSLIGAFAPRLDGVSVDWTGLTRSWNPSKEAVYELDSDVHLGDPARVVTMGNWDHSDVREVAEEVGPWFGNSYSANHETPPDRYADAYEYYTLWEIFGRVATAFRERARYEALAAVHEDLRATIEADLPPESERPSVAMVLPSTTDESMWAYRTNAEGYYTAHTRPLGVVDAMAEAGVETGAQIDTETLLEADPEVLFILGGVVEGYHDMPALRERFADDPVASQVTAVDEGRVYAQGTRHQGPLVNLFQLEMGAKQCYPERFGEWPTYESGPYPEIDSQDRLFDYDRVAEVVTEGA